MNNPMTIEAPLKTDADYEAAIDRYQMAIKRTLQEIEKTQDETDLLSRSTEANLQRLHEMLNLGK